MGLENMREGEGKWERAGCGFRAPLVPDGDFEEHTHYLPSHMGPLQLQTSSRKHNIFSNDL